MNLTSKQKRSGFTIVELLIVIVVVGILAAITVVAYNGIQTRAKTSAARNVAAQVQKKIELYNSIKGVYPSNNTTTDLNSLTESSLSGTGVVIAGPFPTTITPATGTTAVKVDTCANPSGYRLFYWNYQAPDQTGQNGLALQSFGGVSSSQNAACTGGWSSGK